MDDEMILKVSREGKKQVNFKEMNAILASYQSYKVLGVDDFLRKNKFLTQNSLQNQMINYKVTIMTIEFSDTHCLRKLPSVCHHLRSYLRMYSDKMIVN